jgi:catechol-2,3-dioxygenase
MIKPHHLAHIVLQTRNIEEMIDWYKTALGFDVRFQHPILSFLSFDEEHHRIALIDMTKIDPAKEVDFSASKGGVEHVAFTYASVHDLFETYKRLKALEIEPYWCIHHGMTLSMYYGDPDGNQIEFQVEVFDDAEKANEFLATKTFMENPIGIDFDPDQLVADFESGVSEQVILKYPERGEMSVPKRAPNR